MNKNIKTNSLLIGIYASLCFPLFYFVYKYSTPFLGMIDFYDYYKLYDKMDYHSADSPLNMRLVSSFFVFCLSKIGFFYDTTCAVDNAPFSKVIYFNAIFFNYICVVLTCTVIFHLVKGQGASVLMSFLAGLLYVLGFGTIFFELMPLTDAMAVLIFSIILFYYFKKSNLILIPLIVLILQREYLFMALGLYALIDYVYFKNKYYLQVFVYCLVFFGIHVLLRKLIFETSRYAYHTNIDFLANSLTNLKFPLVPFIKQTLMTMNIFIIYLFIISYKFIYKMNYNNKEFVKIMYLLLQLLILTFVLGLGNNAGRYFYLLIPLIIIQIFNEIKTFKFEYNNDHLS